ncbi:MAG: HAMP domain-containing histidine kinase [Eubacterium sp.]|nr:HAMP domain-containing histidine kinase [Eubacterium sp.]
MKRRILCITILFSLLLVGAAFFVSMLTHDKSQQSTRSEEVLVANEIARLIDAGEYTEAREKADRLGDSLRGSTVGGTFGKDGIIVCGLAIFFMGMVFLYVYFKILRPFDRMKEYAAEIAKGNFDVGLNVERSNYFGAFTWAFDCMRKEITRSRAAEREAVENNKTVIATLSHDIKTPIASIRAYAEGLEANLDTTPERRAKYVSVIMRKCDEVTTLTNDLFLHSLSDLGKLQMQPEEFEAVPFLEETIREISAEQQDVEFEKPDFSPVISTDKKRLTQVVENLINNSRKYAKTKIRIFMTEKDGMLELHFTDEGPGIPDEDMPFITGKFYRGRNAGEENGSGLGLYIVRYIAEQSGGSLMLQNRGGGETGLEAVVSIPIRNEM